MKDNTLVHFTWVPSVDDLDKEYDGSTTVRPLTYQHKTQLKRKMGIKGWKKKRGRNERPKSWWSEGASATSAGIHDGASRLFALTHAERCKESGHAALAIFLGPGHPQFEEDFSPAWCPKPHFTSERRVALVDKNGRLSRGLVVVELSHPPKQGGSVPRHDDSAWSVRRVLVGGELVPEYGPRRGPCGNSEKRATQKRTRG